MSVRTMARWLGLVLCLVCALGVGVPTASADRGFTPRFSTNDAGDITIAGNTLATCSTTVTTCAAARQGSSTLSGNALNDNGYQITAVDADSDASTFNSSTSDLTLPAGATVLFAGLYYGGDLAQAPRNAAALNQVLFRAPGATTYANLTASVVDLSSSNAKRYSAFVDVTARVRSAGAGTYGVANVQTSTTGSDHYAGWSLVVAYRDAAQPPRALTVFDGLQSVAAGAPIDIPVSGFRTPPAGPVSTSFGAITYEGDLGLGGDFAQIKPASRSSFVTLTDAQNPTDNPFNSTISRFGARVTTKSPDYANQLGYDADLFDANGLLGNSDTSAVLRVGSTQDVYTPAVLTFATQLFSPNLVPTKSVANVTRPGQPARAGDVLRYAVSYVNRGQDTADDFRLRDPIPAGTAYLPGTLRVTQGPNAPASPTDAAGDDLGEYDAGADEVRLRLGTGATATAGGRIGATGSTTATVAATFDVRVDPDASNGDVVTNRASADFRGTSLGTPFVDQQTPPVATTLTRPDLTLQKTHTGSLVAGGTADFRLLVRNVGGAPTDGQVVVTDPFPAESFDAVRAPGGQGWDCSSSSGLTVRCVRSDALAAGDSYPPILAEADVRDDAPATVSNTAGVTGGGDNSPANGSSTDAAGTVAQADVELTKSASPASVVSGGRVTFRLVARNAGPSTAAGVQVSDTLDPALYADVVATSTQGTCTTALVCTLGAIAPRRTATVTVSARVLANATTLTNTATASADTADPVAANNTASADVEVPNSADLSVLKTGAPTNPVVGQTYTYSLAVTNAGPGTATGVRLVDDLPDGLDAPVVTAPTGWTCNAPGTGGVLECTRSELASGATSTVRVAGTLDASLGGSSFTNTAGVSSTSTDPSSADNTSTATATAASAADLALSKSFTARTANVGGTATFTLGVANRGPSAATNVVITDPLPAGLTFRSSSNAACTATAGTVTCRVGSLANGASFSSTITVDVTATGSANLQNVASVRGDQGDPLGANDVSSDRLTVNAAADLSLRKVADGGTPTVGGTLGYTLTLANGGPNDATGVGLTDPLPDGTTFESISAPTGLTCTTPAVGAAGTVSCTEPTLGNGASQAVRLVVRIGASLAGGTLRNAATASSATTDPVDENNRATSDVTVAPLADLVMSKQASTLTPRPNQDVTYTLGVTNRGPNDATGVVVTDTLPQGVDVVRLDDGCTEALGVVTCQVGTVAGGATASRTITVNTQLATAGTSRANTASVTASTPDPDTSNNTAPTVTVAVQDEVDLRLTKTPSTTTPAANGQFSYALRVTNGGPSAAAGVTLTDPLPAGLRFVSAAGCTESGGTVRCAIASLASGDSQTRTIVVAPLPSVQSSRVSNRAEATSTTPETNAADNAASADVTVGPLVDLAASISPSDASPAVGEPVTFTVGAANAGPSTATGVTTTTTLPAGFSFVSSPDGCTASGQVVTCPIGAVVAGADATVRFVAVPDATAAGQTLAVVVDASAAETDANPADNRASVEISTGSRVDLRVAKTASTATPAAGSRLTYTLTVGNDGPSDASGVRLSDPLPGGLRFVSAAAGCAEAGGTVTCDVGPLAVGATASREVVVEALTTAAGQAITNGVSASADQPDRDPSSDRAETTVTVGPSADLGVTQTASDPTPAAGGSETYTVVASNAGPSDAEGVVLTDVLPAGVDVVSATPSQGDCQVSGQTVACAFGTVPSGGSVQVVVVVQVAPDASGPLTATATVQGAQPDPVTANDAASTSIDVAAPPSTTTTPPATTTTPTTTAATTPTSTAPAPAAQPPAAGSPQLAVTKRLLSGTSQLGAPLRYRITVSNTGSGPATGVRVVDTFAARVRVTYVAASPGTTCTTAQPVTCVVGTLDPGRYATIDLVARATEPGRVVNAVSASGEQGGVLGESEASTTVRSGRARVTLTKRALQARASVGDVVSFVLQARNRSASTPATDVRVCDDLPRGLAFVSARGARFRDGAACWTIDRLAPGASRRFVVNVRVQAAASSTRRNTATVQGDNARRGVAAATVAVAPARSRGGGVTG